MGLNNALFLRKSKLTEPKSFWKLQGDMASDKGLPTPRANANFYNILLMKTDVCFCVINLQL